MAPQYGYYEDSTLQNRSNWSYVYKVDEQGRMGPPQLMLTATYYPPSYYATINKSVDNYHSSQLPLQRTKITRIKTVVRDVSGINPYSKPRRQQVDDFGTDLREEVMKVINQGNKLLGSYDAGDDYSTVAGMGGAQYSTGEFEYNDHRDVVRGDEVSRYDGTRSKQIEGAQRCPKVNGHQGGLGWYRGRAKEEQDRGNQRSLPQWEYYGGNGSYPHDHSGVDNRMWKPEEEIGGNKMLPNTNRQPSYRRHQSGGVKNDYDDSRLRSNSQLEGNHMTSNSSLQQQYRGYHDIISNPTDEQLTGTWTTPDVNPRHDRYLGVDDYDHSRWIGKPLEDGRQRWNTQNDVGYGMYGFRHQYSGLDDDNGSNWWKSKPPTDEHIAGGNRGFYTEQCGGGYSNFFFHRSSGTA